MTATGAVPTTPTTVPTVVPPGAGERVVPPPGVAVPSCEVKLPAAAGAGFSVLDYQVPPRFSPPPVLHRHTRESCAVYVLSGELHYWFADGDRIVTPATLVHLPAGAWFRWANERAEPARILCIFAPAGFEGFFLELGRSLAAAGWEPAALRAQLGPLRARYGDESHQAT